MSLVDTATGEVVAYDQNKGLAVYEQCETIERWAAECDSVPELRDAGNKLAAIDEYLSKTSTEGRARVAAAQRRLEVRVGVLLGPAEVGRPVRENVDRDRHSDVSRDQRADFRRMAEHPDIVDEVIAKSTDEEPASRRKVTDAIRKRSIIQSSESNEWYTPSVYIEAARTVMGGIDLDPASCEEANRVVRAERYYCDADDGLSKPWPGRVWLNPPYGRLGAVFISRLLEVFDDGTEAAICLLNAHCTDTKWFQPLWNETLCFTDHRIDFAGSGGGSTHGSVFAYLGPDPTTFARHFAEFGPVVKRWP